MLTPDGPKVIEFNVRFGDPEAQVVMPLLEGPVRATCCSPPPSGSLGGDRIDATADRAVGVVLASRGYPANVETGQVIAGLDDAAAVPGRARVSRGDAARATAASSRRADGC